MNQSKWDFEPKVSKCYYCKAIQFKTNPTCSYGLRCFSHVCSRFHPIDQTEMNFRKERIERLRQRQQRQDDSVQERLERQAKRKHYMFKMDKK